MTFDTLSELFDIAEVRSTLFIFLVIARASILRGAATTKSLATTFNCYIGNEGVNEVLIYLWSNLTYSVLLLRSKLRC